MYIITHTHIHTYPVCHFQAKGGLGDRKEPQKTQVPGELCPACWVPLGRSVTLSEHLCLLLCLRPIDLGPADLQG